MGGGDGKIILPLYAIGVSLSVFTFIESSVFTKYRPLYLDDIEFAQLQLHLLSNPFAGDVIPGTGGIRKVRWSAEGKGKRGGVRVIYLTRIVHDEIWLLTLYSKAKFDDIPKTLLLKLLEGFQDE